MFCKVTYNEPSSKRKEIASAVRKRILNLHEDENLISSKVCQTSWASSTSCDFMIKDILYVLDDEATVHELQEWKWRTLTSVNAILPIQRNVKNVICSGFYKMIQNYSKFLICVHYCKMEFSCTNSCKQQLTSIFYLFVFNIFINN